MSRTLRRPMFRRGGPANDGIMSGIEDRKQLANGTGLDVDRARLESMAISNIMDELFVSKMLLFPRVLNRCKLKGSHWKQMGSK